MANPSRNASLPGLMEKGPNKMVSEPTISWSHGDRRSSPEERRRPTVELPYGWGSQPRSYTLAMEPPPPPPQPSIASLSSQLGFPEDPQERIVEESLRSVEGMLRNLDKQLETLDWWMEYRKEVYPSYFPVELPYSPPPTPQQQYIAPSSFPQTLQQQCWSLQQQEETEPEVFDEMPVKKLGSMSWCRRCKIQCVTMEGLVLHSLTSEHQNMTMTLVTNIKQNIPSTTKNARATGTEGVQASNGDVTITHTTSEEDSKLNVASTKLEPANPNQEVILLNFLEGGQPAATASNGSWEAFPSPGGSSQLTSVCQIPAANKRKRFSVFLTKAYEGSKLIDKHPLFLWKENILKYTGYRGLEKNIEWDSLFRDEHKMKPSSVEDIRDVTVAALSSRRNIYEGVKDSVHTENGLTGLSTNPESTLAITVSYPWATTRSRDQKIIIWNPGISIFLYLQVLDSSEYHAQSEFNEAFWCFEMLLRRMCENFQREGPTGVRNQLQGLWKILSLTDSKFFEQLSVIEAESIHFAFRMLLVFFRRGLSFTEALRIWEMMWAVDFHEAVAQQLEENCLDLLVLWLQQSPYAEIKAVQNVVAASKGIFTDKTRKDALDKLLWKGFDITILGSNDFYSYRNRIEACGLPLTLDALAEIPPLSSVTFDVEDFIGTAGSKPEVAKFQDQVLFGLRAENELYFDVHYSKWSEQQLPIIFSLAVCWKSSSIYYINIAKDLTLFGKSYICSAVSPNSVSDTTIGLETRERWDVTESRKLVITIWDPGPSSNPIINVHVCLDRKLKDPLLDEGVNFHVWIWDPGSAIHRRECNCKMDYIAVYTPAATNLEEALKGTLTVRPFPLGTSFSSKMEKQYTHFLGEIIVSNVEVKSRLQKFWHEEIGAMGVPGNASFQEWLEISVVLWQTNVTHGEGGQVIPTTRGNLYAFQLTAKPTLEPNSSKHAIVVPCLDEPDAHKEMTKLRMVWDPGINVISFLTLRQGQFEGVGIVTSQFCRLLTNTQVILFPSLCFGTIAEYLNSPTELPVWRMSSQLPGSKRPPPQRFQSATSPAQSPN